jgi:hypothetical protein
VAQDGTVTSGSATDLYYFISDQTGEFGLKCGYEQDGSDAQEYRMTKQSYLASYCLYRDSETSYGFRGDTALSLTETGDPIPSLPSDTAYIQLIEFNGNAATEFEQCLRVMKSRGKNNLILDLRNDGGGYLDIMRSIASHLLKNATGSSPVVATANYPKSGKTTSFYATGNDYYSYFTESSHVYLLANAGTASASECLIGAMVDYGTIAFSDIVLQGEVGSARTYGKGIMQSHFPSISGDVMKLTVATVHWPVSGKSIHGVGVTEADGARAIDTPTLEKGDSFLTGVIDLLPKTSTGSTIE